MDKEFKIIKIDHIAFATESINKTKNLFLNILGLNTQTIEEVKSEKVNVLKMFVDEKDTAIELLEPLNQDSTIKKFIDKNGSKLHHVALEVDNITNLIKYLQHNNIPLIYNTPRLGSGNKLITFIDPKACPGLLLEICQQQ